MVIIKEQQKGGIVDGTKEGSLMVRLLLAVVLFQVKNRGHQREGGHQTSALHIPLLPHSHPE